MDNEILKKLKSIEASDQTSGFPPMVKGRVLHADADVFAYKALDLDYSLASNKKELDEIIRIWKGLSGAEYVHLHLTMGNKGGRNEIAQVKKYQGNRRKHEPAKRDRLDELKQYMSLMHTDDVKACAWYDQEADDGMCQAMQNNTKDVLFTIDKDLWMVPGKHINKETFEIEEFPDGFGKCWIEVDESGKKKVRGRGTSWFWHQLLAGDTADNIPGLPELEVAIWVKYAPTQKYVDLTRRIASKRLPNDNLMTNDQYKKTVLRFSQYCKTLKPKKCGPVLAHEYLKDCLPDRMAYQRVLEAYYTHYGETFTFINWKKEPVTCNYKDMLLEQARLLWMRRTKGEDVKEWLQTISQ